ncbi:DUF5677 domain-containing protein [Priestia megaterium]|uniref:DUF5677 domain-containing protein n=1 Tax=Priestia megaterium TaxID=1404 RepID=UPI0011A89898|nr:DUF5677 domain-containing protein [Priestia megaterium]
MATEEKMSLFDKVFTLYNDLQHEEKFTDFKEPVMNLIYHLVLKNQRSLKTMQIIMDSQEIKNSYLETLPLLRIQLETFFHLVYITEHKNTDICIDEYQNLQNLQLRKVARNLKELNKEKPNRLNDYEKEFMNLHKNKRITRDIKHLDKLWKLAEVTKKTEEYVRIYSVLSSYVHYNPSTRLAYANQKEDKVIYNQFIPNEQEENVIIQYAIWIGLSTIKSTSEFLDIKEVKERNYKVFKEWENIFRNKN